MTSHAGRAVADGRDGGRRRRRVLFRRDAGAFGCPRDIDRPGTAHGNESPATACFLRGCAFTSASRRRYPQPWKKACVMPRWLTVLALLTAPIQNVVSRRYEAEADWRSLNASH